ncbi:hypothetical protein [Paenibacillus typhae]|uniref:Uncharacterized protein n=1 Tax=Paenibacillus typhae TaxID=1174501 RepID=A0A1G8F733_9BACL|nr:hypothetical protein [Paenibacillus typhae]SDH77809.1 hypothetical protein SAMN05216192_101150 [Paenibacillus typhae]
MKELPKPYFIVNEKIYFTDRVEEVFVFKAESGKQADAIGNLLNEAYKAAYQDGLAASLSEESRELNHTLITLSIENTRLKKLLKMSE